VSSFVRFCWLRYCEKLIRDRELSSGRRRGPYITNPSIGVPAPSSLAVMTEEDSIEDSSTPSMMDSSTESTDESNHEETIDRSGEPDAEEKANEFKDRGNQEQELGHYLQAIQLYTEGLMYRPNHAILLSNRAMAYIKIENYGLALLDADTAIESDPSYAKAYYRRASANFALHHFKLARKDFRTVCKLTPKSKDARLKLAQVEKEIKEEAFAKAIEADQTSPLSLTYDPNTIEIVASYDGPHPASDGSLLTDMESESALFQPGSLPRDFVMAACQFFKSEKLIHRRYVARVLLSARMYFSNLPSLLEIDVPAEAPSHDRAAAPRVTVCGDTHGQYYDVLNIFDKNGWPDATNPYVFNGDFVDRGSFSVEVILMFLLWKLHDPTCIYLSRGNHETKNMNRIYGFEGEVKAKYDDKIFQLFLEVFEWLPLAMVIGKKVFITHGGLPVDPDVTLDDIRNIKRGMEPPEKGLMSDLLWSDPQPFPGKAPSKRGVGFAFGPDITASFLERNNLTLLVRSHEVKEEGYLIEHGGKTITVFSAPNYCDTMGNKGAYIHFDASLDPTFTQFEAVPHPNVKPMAYAAGMGGLFA
jgi:serine/threonine-protein phosphatase 5